MILVMLEKLFVNGRMLHCKTGSDLFGFGEPVEFVFFLHQGTVLLERQLEDGRTICQQRADAGDVVAEASLYSDRYHCSARCGSDVTLKAVRKTDFNIQLSQDPNLATEWAAHLARTVQMSRLLSEIRSLRSISDRLDAWLAVHGALPEKGHWQSVAHDIAVSREALYRELARRRG